VRGRPGLDEILEAPAGARGGCQEFAEHADGDRSLDRSRAHPRQIG